jgi:LemA protein
MKQEKQVFSDLANARTQYAGAQTVDQKSAAASNLESSLGRLLVIVENYPQLQSNQNVNKLMDELSGTENRIAIERKRFNDDVTAYNLIVIRFPQNVLANMFGFKQRNFFQSNPAAETVPEVKFNQ